jgi:hypothetical protein
MKPMPASPEPAGPSHGITEVRYSLPDLLNEVRQ